MTTSVYLINKGINKPILFHGLRAQYILYAGAIITGDTLLFAVLYISGINSWIGPKKVRPEIQLKKINLKNSA